MNVLFVAPSGARAKALATETRRAVDAGHRVLLVAEGESKLDGHELDGRVQTHWIGSSRLSYTEPRATRLFRRRLPLAVLRRVGRGPLRARARRAAKDWRERVVAPLDAEQKTRTQRMRRDRRDAVVREQVQGWAPDWVVLHEPLAVEAVAGFLPALIAERPALRTTYAFEELWDETDG
ncbi:hypothetical protein GCM10009830_32650 [Glycomyces endophyticus]|uniref:Uncharacterized protein n=1 Tax=Glycomyces endophyticus TaxID=480996 RepID=A0ABP4T608_9ACTN